MALKNIFFSFRNLLSFVILSLSCGPVPHTLVSKKDYYQLQKPEGELKISILSLNILAPIDFGALSEGYRSWYERKNELVSFLLERKSDFIALQEITPSVLDEFKEEFSENYKIIENKSYTPDSILLFKKDKFELLESGWWILEPPFSFNMRRIAVWGKFREKVSKSELFVASTHLSNPGEKKEKEARELLKQVDQLKQKKSALFLAGDFNFEESHELSFLFEKAGWKNASTNEEKTYPSKNPRKKIDHIFYSLNSTETISYKVWSEKIFSDHFPIEAHFKIR